MENKKALSAGQAESAEECAGARIEGKEYQNLSPTVYHKNDDLSKVATAVFSLIASTVLLCAAELFSEDNAGCRREVPDLFSLLEKIWYFNDVTAIVHVLRICFEMFEQYPACLLDRQWIFLCAVP